MALLELRGGSGHKLRCRPQRVDLLVVWLEKEQRKVGASCWQAGDLQQNPEVEVDRHYLESLEGDSNEPG